MKRLAVIGAGWAGLSAAVRATQRGWRVTLYEMGGGPGGRARSLPQSVGDRLSDQTIGLSPGVAIDNGQHILIGAYADTLKLMREVGVDPETVLHRGPLDLRTPDGQGLRLPTGHPALALMRGMLGAQGWTGRDRWGLIHRSLGWALRGYRCGESITVAELCAGLPARVLDDLIEPLCVAALNTPSATASAAVFLRVLQDALLGGHGASDLLLPKAPLDALLPQPAWAWLTRAGAQVRPRTRVERLTPARRSPAPRRAGWWTAKPMTR
jgi:hydroxysqualene dehydroxylase